MPSDEAQQIINRGMGSDPTEAARLIREATDEILLEVLAGASFRGLSGFVFERHGVHCRQVKCSYAAECDRLLSSGLDGAPVERGLCGKCDTIAEPLQGDHRLGRSATYATRCCS